MKTMKTIAAVVLAATIPALSAPVAAQASGATPPPPGRMLPEPKTENGVTYLCGGIGIGEADRMRELAGKYDLMVTFAASNGAFLADVGVEIAHGGNTLVKAQCDAPIMLVDAPKPGSYRITARTDGNELVRTARVQDGKMGQLVTFTWPLRVVDKPNPAARN